jgi:leader peptidase (prepilin peptidase)/N-methyltransferase
VLTAGEELAVVIAFVMFILGVSIGSFLNVVADRVPAGKSFIKPPSHCFKCGRKLEPLDLIPVISYLYLRGKCRYCGERISSRSLWVEIGTGCVFLLAWLQLGLNWQLINILISCSILVIVFIVDLEHKTVPGTIIYPAIVIALLLSVSNQYINAYPEIKSSLSGLGLALLTFLIIWAISRSFRQGVIDSSDAFIMGYIGAAAGFPLIILTIYIAVLFGGVAAAVLMALKLRRWNERMPFSLFACPAAMLTLIWGNSMWQWWMSTLVT